MKKMIKGMACLLVACTCTGCATKTTFEKFHQYAEKITAKENPYKSANAKGTHWVEKNEKEYEFNFKVVEGDWVLETELNGSDYKQTDVWLLCVTALYLKALDYMDSEYADTTYYKSSTLKVVEDDKHGTTTTIEWNTKGYCTKYKRDLGDQGQAITISYK